MIFHALFSHHHNNTTAVEVHSECGNNNVLGASIISSGDKQSGSDTMGYCDINVPVYATVKGVSIFVRDREEERALTDSKTNFFVCFAAC